ncbi:hypothetical protein [Desulfotruncus arcticus]|uniref:hypothetical protein n=1 Tax=Desulfotruncus arcticus TaxID=341036 RepID=UPI001EE49A40|nr:hypothetical protein [Desulfotruncus arcticus]
MFAVRQLEGKNPKDILELAKVFFLFSGDMAELARGIKAYYQELGMGRMCADKSFD